MSLRNFTRVSTEHQNTKPLVALKVHQRFISEKKFGYNYEKLLESISCKEEDYEQYAVQGP